MHHMLRLQMSLGAQKPKTLYSFKEFSFRNPFFGFLIFNRNESLEFGGRNVCFWPSIYTKTVFWVNENNLWHGEIFPFFLFSWGQEPLNTKSIIWHHVHMLTLISIGFLQRFVKVSNMTIHYHVFYIVSSVLIQETSFYNIILLCIMAEEVRYWLQYRSQQGYINFTYRLHGNVFFCIARCFSFLERHRINDLFLHVFLLLHAGCLLSVDVSWTRLKNITLPGFSLTEISQCFLFKFNHYLHRQKKKNRGLPLKKETSHLWSLYHKLFFDKTFINTLPFDKV